MIFHSYLISNRQFQDVVKNFSDLLYFENEASYEKVLFYTFELFFHVESFSLLSYVYHQLRIYYEQNKRELPREIWKTSLLFFCPVSDTWKYRTNAGIETQPRFFRFQFIRVDYAFLFFNVTLLLPLCYHHL